MNYGKKRVIYKKIEFLTYVSIWAIAKTSRLEFWQDRGEKIQELLVYDYICKPKPARLFFVAGGTFKLFQRVNFYDIFRKKQSYLKEDSLKSDTLYMIFIAPFMSFPMVPKPFLKLLYFTRYVQNKNPLKIPNMNIDPSPVSPAPRGVRR